MNERIISLLRLCMEAQSKGINIDFDQNSRMVIVHDVTVPEKKATFFICLRLSSADREFTRAENYLKEVIANANA